MTEPESYERMVAAAQQAAGEGFMGRLGLVIDDLASERVSGHLEVGPQHHQPYGIVHGGVYCSIVESLASYAAGYHASSQDSVVVGVSNQTDFLRAHREGRLDATAEPVHLGRTQHLWEVRITRAVDGKLVARGQVRLAVLPGDQELAGRSAAG